MPLLICARSLSATVNLVWSLLHNYFILWYLVNIVGQSHEPEEQSNTLAPSTLRYLCKINNAMHEDVAVFNERIFVPFIETVCNLPNNHGSRICICIDLGCSYANTKF